MASGALQGGLLESLRWARFVTRRRSAQSLRGIGDHGPPHFHVRAGGRGAKVRIDTLEVLMSDLPRRELRLVLAWAEMHAAELDENWRRAREGATLQEIEPLR